MVTHGDCGGDDRSGPGPGGGSDQAIGHRLRGNAGRGGEQRVRCVLYSYSVETMGCGPRAHASPGAQDAFRLQLQRRIVESELTHGPQVAVGELAGGDLSNWCWPLRYCQRLGDLGPTCRCPSTCSVPHS